MDHPHWCNIHDVNCYVQSHTTHSLQPFTVWQLVLTWYIGIDRHWPDGDLYMRSKIIARQ